MFDHTRNIESVEGPQLALPIILEGLNVSSVLDVGCGSGAWLQAAVGYGIVDIQGIDGVDVCHSKLLTLHDKFQQKELTKPWDLKRKFDLAICLEVAEHLDPSCAELLLKNITMHSDLVLFSAACPSQNGQHHVNCQWPVYWQSIFNMLGYVCSDSIRWKIWEVSEIEPWYRQNIFMATRDSEKAGSECRIRSVIHPDMLDFISVRSWNGISTHGKQCCAPSLINSLIYKVTRKFVKSS
jgi:hypothetical protein